MGDAGESAASQVAGSVVSFNTLRPLGGRTVWIGTQSTKTAADGTFTLPAPDGAYDASVVEPDGTVVSVYRGLTRRDPVLPHVGAPVLSYHASVSGNVSGGGNYPLSGNDAVILNFFASAADQFWPLSGMSSTSHFGPAFGPIPLWWDGAASISGELVGLGLFDDGNGGLSTWFAHGPMTLSDGQAATASLALAQVSRTTHLTGAIDMPAGGWLVEKTVAYRLPFVDASVGLPVSPTDAFDDDVPVLDEPGATLCVGAIGKPGSLQTTTCSISPELGPFTVTLQPSPALSSPQPDSTVASDTSFTWSAFDAGIYLLQLDAFPSSAAAPSIHVFTSETSLPWPDLTSLGVAFPSGASYDCAVAGLGPYGSMDDALAPTGIGAPFPDEVRRSFSPTISLTTSP